MPIDNRIATRLRLPAVCAPMFFVSTPDLVREACLAGLVGGVPRHNARSIEEFEAWLRQLRHAFDRHAGEREDAVIGPLAVNLASKMPPDEFEQNLAVCQRYGVDIIINATGNPVDLTRRAHDRGFLVYADAINLRFAEKAVEAGVDGITAIGSGSGGFSGTANILALLASIRGIFSGTIIMAGGISTGRDMRAAEVLGADLCYMGTRFIATRESGASAAYKELLVSARSSDIIYKRCGSNVPANWIKPSLDRLGLDAEGDLGDLPKGVIPWRDVWSAGHGVDQINDIPSVAQLARRLRREYSDACQTAPFPALLSA